MANADGYGITSTGYNKKSYNDLITWFESKLRSSDSFGESIDFSDQDPLKLFSTPILLVVSELWDIAEQTFFNASPLYAEGNPLSNTGKYIGIARKQASKSTGIVRFIGTSGTNIALGYQVSNTNNIIYKTTATGTITNGYVDLAVEALVAGSNGNTAAGTITKIINPIVGLTSINNQAITTGGQDEETDTAFRARYAESTASGAGSTVDAIKANVLKVTDVQDCSVTENDLDVTTNGIPAKSFLTLVKGGNDTLIAKAIFEKKPAGIFSAGSTRVSIVDSQGVTHDIGFSRPTDVNIWVKVDVTTNSNFPSDGNTQIKAAVKNYIDSMKLGESVINYQIVTAISRIGLSGLLDMVITLSTDGTTYNPSNVSINNSSIAVTDISKIEVI